MDFALSDEQEALAEAERAWLTKNDPIAARRPAIDDGPARTTPEGVQHLAESGLIGLLTEDMGGTHVDLAVLVEEHGRAGSPLPVAELAIATRLLEQLDHPVFEDAESGAKLVVPALPSLENSALHAQVDGTTLRLSGTTAPTTGLVDAHSVLVVVSTDSGTEVAAVLPVDTVTVRTLETLDLTRSWSVAEVDVILEEGNWSVLQPGTVALLHDELTTFRALDALGAAARLVDVTVEYAGQRTQFDKPIASFQAIKHHCANMALSVEASRAALWAAAVALDGDDADARTRSVSAAAAFTGEGASATAQTALQVHGGIGFTWEHDVHLLIRRIKVDELLDGSVSYHRRRLVSA
ncbi:acyl-CoA dehydrogenase family protein [Rhodococcus artemisiae]|uniref:Acyl-CoA dehydrogenase family protein n=1 Tax=Rhodococcus artemisiae TaxID=714159 RepID=A0ABU7L6S2_9NOCA|nr:acyl-CoA dehydrogenase family protein [Rhodococcus artemisiae]MEE2057223.1 acyl-CoA dehydrogenase family protein [Rhodococcus artemisiae]